MSSPKEKKAKPTDGSFAFKTAATVLGVIALAQVAAVVWFVFTYEPKKDDAGAGTAATAAAQSEANAVTHPASTDSAATEAEAHRMSHARSCEHSHH